MRQTLAEEIFLAALLQDVGMLALDQAVPDLYRDGEKLQRDHAALAEHEKKCVQADHAHVGGWLMRTWNLPERLCHAIEHSHRVELSCSALPAGIFDRCVALSGPVADLFLLDAEQRPFAETALRAENARPQSLGALRSAIVRSDRPQRLKRVPRRGPRRIKQCRTELMS